MEDVLATAITTIVGGSCIANPAEIAGNTIESNTDNKLLQTAAKVLQSVNLSLLSVWATFHAADFFNIDIWSMPVDILQGAFFFAFSIPILGHLAEKIFPNHKGKIEAWQNNYSIALKILNIAAATFCLTFGIYMGYAIPMLLLSGASIISSAYALQKKISFGRVSIA